jgi:hypothetical protein
VLELRTVGKLAACAVPVLGQRPRVGFSVEESRVGGLSGEQLKQRPILLLCGQPSGCPAIDVLVRVRVTLRLTVSQPVSLGVEPLLGLMTRFFSSIYI